MKTEIARLQAAFFVATAAALAAVPATSSAHGAGRAASRTEVRPRSTATPIFERELPNVPGKSLLAVEVVYPPGGGSASHRHPASSFIYAYVVSGAIVSAVDEERPRVFRAGQSFYEAPGAHHRISRNASSTRPAKLLAVFIKDSGRAPLVLPDSR
jgi:quercetin dioxygenase-like cupin family protein